MEAVNMMCSADEMAGVWLLYAYLLRAGVLGTSFRAGAADLTSLPTPTFLRPDTTSIIIGYATYLHACDNESTAMKFTQQQPLLLSASPNARPSQAQRRAPALLTSLLGWLRW